MFGFQAFLWVQLCVSCDLLSKQCMWLPTPSAVFPERCQGEGLLVKLFLPVS